MAAKIAKIQLEMKDGVRVRTISELKENFDVEKLVGYYLDGKLKKWLETRWYEEELEALEALYEDDKLLTKHLCEIFGIEYEDVEMDSEEIAEKNMRISKIKQYTEDDEIIKHIDWVAFNQEELVSLYAQNIEKIYLCEGEFKIPESKKNLSYMCVGEVLVEGIQDNDEACKDGEEQMGSESIISQELADVIRERVYAESKDYVVWTLPVLGKIEYSICDKKFFSRKEIPYRESNLYIWDRRKDQFFFINIGNGVNIDRTYLIEDKLVICSSGWGNKMKIYDINSGRIKCIYEKHIWDTTISIHDSKIAFRRYATTVNERTIVILDVHSLEETDSGLKPDDPAFMRGKFHLTEKYLFFEKENTIQKYDMLTKITMPIFKQKQLKVRNMILHDNTLFVHYFDDYCKEGGVIGINQNEQITYNEEVGEYDDSYVASSMNLFLLRRYNGIYVLNMGTKECEFIPMEVGTCEVICIVGQYMYYRTYKEKLPSHRINLCRYKEGADKI